MGGRPHALVTGASSGIGAAIVERLLREGWRVTGISRRPAPFDHPAYDHLSIDLGNTTALASAVAGIAPTALVHAAGLLKVGQLGALDHEDGAAMWRLHVDVAGRLADALAPRLPEGGRIVFIGSRTASGAAGRGQYAATKAALVALARSWAIELAPRGITVNVVAPAATETPMLKDPTRSGVAPKLPPIGRFIRPDEVAATVAFLLSGEAAAITGQQLVICGGSSLS
ncbi:SDR family oxidoreductase [Bradyrhizobium manausense]|uniref:SDR family oxidoreductase n=1 Tax=Bradyrhizobium TaxID=374 RepID=UPI001BAB37D1|nr:MULTISPECIES: SDR family oxidoreductase [Bradyrhizobium]MBR0828023.1 SDR family oxidoreductase [Bradyrhizobium manausense]UVO32886.1 SDR family oxidoreductase [Bradyrhizobium arachidis]